jgi:predicted TPR repeat methyltransferase
MNGNFSEPKSPKLTTAAVAIVPDSVDSITAKCKADEVKSRIAELRRAIVDKPDDYRNHYELGVALGEVSRFEEAIGSFMMALRLEPSCDEACNMIGSAFALRGMLEPAIEWFERAQRINPSETDYLHRYGIALLGIGRDEQARQVFTRWMESQPENPVAQHLASAAIGDGKVSTASPKYVVSLFDGCAASFDASLARLKYSGPQLVVDALKRFSPPAVATGQTFGCALDVGCGTGLVGALLRPLAGRLVGVDLSAGMLRQAGERGIYDELVEADMVDYLCRHPRQFDAIAAADVLTYVGDLAAFFQAAVIGLKRGGVVVVLTEALLDGEAYRLNLTGRFSHAPGYLCSIMENSGLTVAELRQDTMRREANRPVPTFVVVGTNGGESALTR